MDYADAALQVGAPDEAAVAVGFLRQGFSPPAEVIAAADRCAALVAAARGNAGHAVFQLTDVVAREGVESPFESARSRLALGQVARRAGRKGLAAHELNAAAETFDRIGSPWWAARARGNARRAGLQPSSASRRIPAASTATYGSEAVRPT